jgi:hypothetical protein
VLDNTPPFAELKARSDVTERARAATVDAAFSARIRDGLPGASERAAPLRVPLTYWDTVLSAPGLRS